MTGGCRRENDCGMGFGNASLRTPACSVLCLIKASVTAMSWSTSSISRHQRKRGTEAVMGGFCTQGKRVLPMLRGGHSLTLKIQSQLSHRPTDVSCLSISCCHQARVRATERRGEFRASVGLCASHFLRSRTSSHHLSLDEQDSTSHFPTLVQF